MSNVIKSNFVSWVEGKKSIEHVPINHTRIINPEPTEAGDDGEHPEEGVHHTSEDSLENQETTKDQQESLTSNHDLSKAEADRRIRDAIEQAEVIVEEAERKAAIIIEEAFEKGYEKGMVSTKQQLAAEQAELKATKEALEQHYHSAIEAIEPKMVGLVRDLVERLVGYTTINESVIGFIIRKGFEEVALSGHITIRVSEMDYEYVLAHQETLFKHMSEKTTTEILLDHHLNKNDCIIETDLGNIECSLDHRLKGLMAELTLIQESLQKDD